MGKAGNKFTAVFTNKCPNCFEGNFFETNNPYNLKKFAKMNPCCPVCKMDYKQEPGFYFGAGYLSYGLQAVWIVGAFIIFDWLLNLNTFGFISLTLLTLVVTLPVNFRLSRQIWLTWVGNYSLKKSQTPNSLK